MGSLGLLICATMIAAVTVLAAPLHSTRKECFPMPSHLTPEERFWAKVDRSGDCWLWLAGKTSRGYGRFRLGRKTVRAHRMAYELACGPIPAGLVLHHRCGNPSCVKVWHLVLTKPRGNILRGFAFAAVNVGKLCCPQGHPYSGKNSNGSRVCRICTREQDRRYKESHRDVLRERALVYNRSEAGLARGRRHDAKRLSGWERQRAMAERN
jgi:hypothetical protein